MQQLAFPGALGHGRFATGGRGGVVYKVTNLNDSGSGSLREAIEASGPRVVIFDVGGTINLSGGLKISNNNISIYGQTAPGDGIAINGLFSVGASNVIIQHIRARYTGGASNKDAVTMQPDGSETIENIILDHISASWGTDEILSSHGLNGWIENLSVTNSFITHGIDGHNMAGLFNMFTRNVSYIKNYLTGTRERHPSFGVGVTGESINNVIYGFQWGTSAQWGTKVDMINNYYRQGSYPLSASGTHMLKLASGNYADSEVRYYPNHISHPTYGAPKIYAQSESTYYISGNETDAKIPNGSDFNVTTASGYSNSMSPSRVASSGYIPEPVSTNVDDVIANSGATLPKRDSYDTQSALNYTNGLGAIAIDDPSEVGGLPSLANGSPQANTSGDGIPDSWKTANGLDINVNYSTTVQSSGYTVLEEYVHSLSNSTPISVTGVTGLDNNYSVNIPDTIQLSVNIEPSNATNQGGTWSSSDEQIATVDSSGLVTPISVGNCTITFNTSDGNFTDSTTLEVTQNIIPISSITLDPSEVVLTETLNQFILDIQPSNATNKGGTWLSSDESVVTVDQNGLTTSVSNGQATISFSSNEGPIGSSLITVNIPNGTTIVSQINSDLGDVKQLEDSPFSLFDSTVELGNDYKDPAQLLKQANGFHFSENINIPSDGSVIVTGARIDFSNIDPLKNTGSLQLDIFAEKTPKPSIFSDIDGDLTTNRPLTTEFVRWDVEEWTDDSGTIYSSADFASVIQEAITQEGRLSTDPINIIIKHVGGTNLRNADSFNTNPLLAPTLYITYENVIQNEVTSVSFNRNNLVIQVDGASSKLIETVLPIDATNKQGVYNSSNQNVATVNQNGVVTPVSEGSCDITFTTNQGGIVGTLAVRVVNKASVKSGSDTNSLPNRTSEGL